MMIMVCATWKYNDDPRASCKCFACYFRVSFVDFGWCLLMPMAKQAIAPTNGCLIIAGAGERERDVCEGRSRFDVRVVEALQSDCCAESVSFSMCW